MADFYRLYDPDSLVSPSSSAQLKPTSPGRLRDQPAANPFPRLEPSTPSSLSDDRGGNIYDGYVPEIVDVEKAAALDEEEDNQTAENNFKRINSFVNGDSLTGRLETFVEGSDDLPIELLSLSDRYVYTYLLYACRRRCSDIIRSKTISYVKFSYNCCCPTDIVSSH